MKLSKTLQVLGKFQVKHHTIAGVIWSVSFLLVAVFTLPWQWSDFAAILLTLPGVVLFIFALLWRYELALEERMAAGAAAPTWLVAVNGVTVGTISDSLYAEIHHRVIFNGRTWCAQLFNLGNVVIGVIDGLMVSIPLGVFWSSLGCYFFAPDVFAALIVEFQKVTPEQIVSSIPILLQLLAVVSALVVAAMAAMGRRFRFINHFDQTVGDYVRRRVGCAAEGNVVLFRIEGDMMIHPNDYTFGQTEKPN